MRERAVHVVPCWLCYRLDVVFPEVGKSRGDFTQRNGMISHVTHVN